MVTSSVYNTRTKKVVPMMSKLTTTNICKAAALVLLSNLFQICARDGCPSRGIGTWAPIEIFSLTKPPHLVFVFVLGREEDKVTSRSLVYEWQQQISHDNGFLNALRAAFKGHPVAKRTKDWYNLCEGIASLTNTELSFGGLTLMVSRNTLGIKICRGVLFSPLE